MKVGVIFLLCIIYSGRGLKYFHLHEVTLEKCFFSLLFIKQNMTNMKEMDDSLKYEHTA